MSKLQCSKCLRIYEFDEYRLLDHVKAVESDEDPITQHGYLAVCRCGAVFHRDKWRLIDVVHTEVGDFRVSTVHLELDHSFNEQKPIWYETMIFLDNGLFDLEEPQWRYEAREEAISEHETLVNALAAGRYELRTERETKRIIFRELV